MWVKLTTNQAVHVARAFHGTHLHDVYAQWVADYAQHISPRRLQILLPAEGWLVAQRHLTEVCFNPRGFWAEEVSTAAHRALKAVTKAINLRRAHPAFHFQAAYGTFGEMLPAWQHNDILFAIADDAPPGAVWQPLVPVHTIRGSQPLTHWDYWRPGDPLPEHPLFEEAAHLRFTVDGPPVGGPEGSAA